MLNPRPAGRPSLSGRGRSSRLAVSLSPELYAIARRRAAALGVTVAELVRRLIASS